MSNRTFTVDPLKDNNFLLELDSQKEREIFARITALTWDENPIEYIDGKVTGGSINLDGASAVRRTCSLNMIAYNINLTNFYQGLNSKIKIEIGIKNKINPNYPDIIWFPQGIFVLTTFNTSVSINTYAINLSAKDKMCLLNGDISGNINSPIDFGVEEYVDLINDTITYTPIPIKDIIRNAVHVYGREPLHNIIISDLDDYGYELLEYRGDADSPMFLLRDVDSNLYTNMTMKKNQSCEFLDDNGVWQSNEVNFGNLEQKGGKYDKRINTTKVEEGSIIRLTADSPHRYQLHKIETNETVGYRLTDLTYAGDLIAQVGEALTSILDKIKNMLGNFEYFYDLDGRFIFQKKPNNIYNNWNPLEKTDMDGTWVDPNAQPLSYMFYDSQYFTSISHNPQLNNLKNDFSIWGEREGISGAKILVHMRYALDRKPVKYYTIPISEQESQNFIDVNKWPFTFNEQDWDKDNETKANAIIRQKRKKYSQNQTLYEASSSLDWRELIYRMALDYFQYNQLDDFIFRVAAANSEEFPTGYTGYEQYYTDMQGFWRSIYNPEEEVKEGDTPNFNPVTYWHNNVTENPSALDFWFDFLGEGTEMDKYLVPVIGPRTKAVNDKDISAIYFKETPDVLFLTNEEYNKMAMGAIQTGYTFIRVNNSLDNFFKISSQGKSALNTLEELLYQNTYCTETINITSIPIYYLQPNIRVGIRDIESKIEGEYIISKISLPLIYNGTMSITATKAADTIY